MHQNPSVKDKNIRISHNLSGLVLEGISGSGKTTLMNALLNTELYRKRECLSSVILSEHQTQRILEKKQREQGLVIEDSRTLLDYHVSYLENLDSRLSDMDWCRRNQSAHRVPFLLERFHLTHIMHYEHFSWEDAVPYDKRLADLGGKLCILTACANDLEQRIFETRDRFWNDYITRFGENRSEILGHFLAQQEELIALARRTALPCMVIDPSRGKIDETAQEIAEFWLSQDLDRGINKREKAGE